LQDPIVILRLSPRSGIPGLHPVEEPEFPAIDQPHAKDRRPKVEGKDAPEYKEHTDAGNSGKKVRSGPVVSRHGHNVPVQPYPFPEYGFRRPVIERRRSREDAGVEPGPEEGNGYRDEGIPPEPEPAPERDQVSSSRAKARAIFRSRVMMYHYGFFV